MEFGTLIPAIPLPEKSQKECGLSYGKMTLYQNSKLLRLRSCDMYGNQIQVSFSRKEVKKAFCQTSALRVSRGIQNGQNKKQETLVSDHILVKWS